MNNVAISGKIINQIQKNEFSGGEVSNFTLLVMGAGNKNSENKNGFVRVAVFGQQSEFLNKYFQEGSYIGVVGSLQQDTWLDKDTQAKRSEIKVLASKLSFPDGPKSGEEVTTPTSEAPPKKIGGKAPKQGDGDYDPFADS